MPLWRIYHPAGTFSDVAEKQALAKAITALYIKYGIPGFYVGVVFSEQPVGTMFRSGEIQPSDTRPPFIRIVWTNIAGGFDGGRNAHKLGFMDQIDELLKPFAADKGYDFEHHGEDADVTLGRIGGFDFPARDSPLELYWREVNEPKPLPEGWQPSK